MKRKVSLHGPSTLTVSLPSKWVSKYKIAKGDELEILEKARSLIITTDKILDQPKSVVEVENFIKFGKRVITALYRNGINEIELYYTDPNYAKIIQEVISEQLIGFEIIRQSSTRCDIKDLSGTSEEGLDIAIRRTWLLILSMAQDCLAGLEKKEKEISTMESIRFRDISVNKFTNYCARILVQKGHKNHMKTPVYYHIIRELERLGDCYKEIAEYSILSNQHIKKETLKNLQKTNTYFVELYSLFYKFDKKRINNLLSESKLTNLDLQKAIEGNQDTSLSYLLKTICNNIRDLASAIIQIYV